MLKKILLTVFILLLLAGAVGGGGYWLFLQLNSPMPLQTEMRYSLKPNTNMSQVAIDFMGLHLINYPTALAWVWLARFEGRAQKIKAGQYAVPIGTTPQKLLDILIEGKTIQYTLTLPEGWTFRQVLAAVAASADLTHTLGNDDDKTIMEKIGHPNEHPEGRFYPDTYLFPEGTTDIAFLQRAYDKMEKELNNAWEKRRPELPLKTAYEALILASLVEKETGAPEERPQIAGVFVRRLQKGMLLQTDPTVIYALGSHYDGNIRKDDLSLKNPYNTYVNKGLPPTPIAMPGKEALVAVVNPAAGESLYFVAKGGGTHYFSKNLNEHECAVIEFQLKGKSPRMFQQRCSQHPSCGVCRGQTLSTASVKT
jgi:UPF0755 protein